MTNLPECIQPPAPTLDAPVGVIIEYGAIKQALEHFYPFNENSQELWPHVSKFSVGPMLTPGYILLSVYVSKYLKLPVYVPLKTYDVDMAAQIYFNVAIPAKQRQHVFNLVNFYLKRPYDNMWGLHHPAYFNRASRLGNLKATK